MKNNDVPPRDNPFRLELSRPADNLLLNLPLMLSLALWSGSATAFWPFSNNGDTDGKLILHGNVDIRQVNVAPEVSGRLEDILVEEGSPVEKGQVLARIDAERYRHAVAQAEAEADAQRQALAALVAGTRPEEIRRLRAELEAARAETSNAERHLQRLEGLRGSSLVSEETVDDARSNLDVARARATALQRQLELALAGPRREDIASAQARLKALEARLAGARLDLADTELKAPQDGVIRERLLQTGDMTGPARPAFSLALTNPVWVRAYVPEPRLGEVQPGAQATVRTDYREDSEYTGWVGYVSPTAEFTPKNIETEELRTDLVYQVRIMVCNPRNELRLGMPATVTITPGAGPENAQPRCGNTADGGN